MIRRLSFDLIGLPPTPAEVEAFLADQRPDAYERLVDRLLASPHYGERWGRHWLDLVRYAETAGHEFDYDIPNALLYRDYVIRALNADVPYDRFVAEHLAGDLLDDPRRHPVERFNESIIATGFCFLGEGTHSPVDVREEEARRIDNQIDVMSKAFLGLTVACARCHDHKFDPIGTRDYYALAGYLRSSRTSRPSSIRPTGSESRCAGGRVAARSWPLWSGAGDPLKPGRRPVKLGSRRARRRSSRTSTATDFAGWHVTGDAFGERPTACGDVRIDVSTRRRSADRCGPAWRTAGGNPTGSRACSARGPSRSVTGTSTTSPPAAGGRSMSWSTASRRSAPDLRRPDDQVDVGDQLRWITQDVEHVDRPDRVSRAR